jgi:preprotein translocase subunit YajC
LSKLPPFPTEAILPIIIFSAIITMFVILLTVKIKKKNKEILKKIKSGDECSFTSRSKGKFIRFDGENAIIEVEIPKHNIYE